MSTVNINIDEIAQEECKPFDVTVGGKTYTIVDIPLGTTKKMNELDKGDGASGADGIEPLIEVVSEILGADLGDINKLGTRKFLTLVKHIMDKLNEEVEGKNVPKVEVPLKP